jgi:glycosyltransferase involved in cell wall biosynthesis
VALRNNIATAGYKRSYESGYDHESRLRKVIETVNSPAVSSEKMKRIVVAIYYDPDFYPPTINAIINLSKKCEELVVVTRNHSAVDFPYPGNVKLIKIGKQISVLASEKKNILHKIFSFLNFTFVLFSNTSSKDAGLLVIYDAIPLFSFQLFKKFISSNKTIWYHNHDMPNTHQVRKYSIGWFASKYEYQTMENINYFSLPSDDRLVYYPKWKDMNRYLSIPNYPSINVYQNNQVSKFINDEVRIIFQGTIGEEHALEELISILNEKIDGKSLRLILKGGVRPHYKRLLVEHAEKCNVSDKVEWIGLGAYCELPALTSTCHIGIAIYMGTDKVRLTLGTASNKIYEYAASGLPVILYDNAQFRKYLEKSPWAFFTDGTAGSLKKCIEQILKDYNNLSLNARESFEANLNFEHAFSKVLEKVISNNK